MENKDLEEFRKAWRAELNSDKQASKTDEQSDVKMPPPDGKQTATDTAGVGVDFFGVEESKTRPNTYQSFLLAEDLLKHNASEIHEKHSANESIRRKRRSRPGCGQAETSELRDGGTGSASGSDPKCRRFLDIFLEDLDEINEIPFFDSSLPRELALGIFRHLDACDLCACAQVSRAWRSLAEDAVLWLGLAHRYGFYRDSVTANHVDWKQRFRERRVRDRTVASNWKSRTGTFRQFCHAGGGVLCDAHSHSNHLVAGYTSGEVKFWNTRSGEECVFQPSCRALELDENEGTNANYVTCVRTNQSVTVAGYSQGYVDVWNNESGTCPVRTFRGPGATRAVRISRDGGSVLAAHGDLVRVETRERGREDAWGQHRLIQTPLHARQADFVETPSDSAVPHVAVAHGDHLTLHPTTTRRQGNPTDVHISLPSDDDVITVHNTIEQNVSVFDVSDVKQTLGYATNCYMEPVAKISLFDLCALKPRTSVHAHAGRVTCLNLRDSPNHVIVTGANDRKAMIHDVRLSATVMTFHRLNAVPNQVQMDDYKVVCGLDDGMVCVFDQRNAQKLWEFHNRHPVQYLHFSDHLLTTANVPVTKFPVVRPCDELDNIKHRRFRGNVQLYDFLAEQRPDGLNEICLSTYDEPDQYNYNIRLAVPYDHV